MKKSSLAVVVSLVLQTVFTLIEFYKVTEKLPEYMLPHWTMYLREIGRILSVFLPPVPYIVYFYTLILLACFPLIIAVVEEFFAYTVIRVNPVVFRTIRVVPERAPKELVAPKRMKISAITKALVSSTWFRVLVFKAAPEHPPLYYAKLATRTIYMGVPVAVAGVVLYFAPLPLPQLIKFLVSVGCIAYGVFSPLSVFLYLYFLVSSRKADLEETGVLYALYLLLGISAGANITKLFEAIREKKKVWREGILKDARMFLNLRVGKSESDALYELGRFHPSDTFAKLYQDMSAEIRLGGSLTELLILRLESIYEALRASLQRRIDFINLMLSGVMAMYSVLPASLLSLGILSTIMGGGGIDILGLSQLLVFVSPALAVLGLIARPPDEFEFKINWLVVLVSATILVGSIVFYCFTPLVSSLLPFPIFVYVSTIASSLPVAVWITRKERKYSSVLDGASRFSFELQDSIRAGRSLFLSLRQLARRDFGAFSEYLREVVRVMEARGINEGLLHGERIAEEPLIRKLFLMLRAIATLGIAKVESFKYLARYFRDLRDSIKSYKSSMILPRIIGMLSTILLLYVLTNMIDAMISLSVYSEVMEQFKMVPVIISNLKRTLPFYVLSIGFITGSLTGNRVTSAIKETLYHALIGLLLTIYFKIY